MTPFRFEHVFAAASPADVLAAYFDPAQVSDQDRRAAILEREVLELRDTGDELVRVSRIVPQRQLPAIVRPFTSGPLWYRETVRWQRAEDALEIELRPSIAKAVITGRYTVERAGDRRILRRYAGRVSVDVALLGRRIERGIVDEMERTIGIAVACTQDWLDLQGLADAAARA